MDRVLGTSISIVIIGLVFFGMYRSWRKRSSRGLDFVLPVFSLVELVAYFDVFYVATTEAENVLERVALPGMSYRGYATLGTSTSGVQLTLRSGESLGLPSECIQSVGLSTTVIDKVVERDGLVSIRWSANDTSGAIHHLATHVRVIHPEDRARILTHINNFVAAPAGAS